VYKINFQFKKKAREFAFPVRRTGLQLVCEYYYCYKKALRKIKSTEMEMPLKKFKIKISILPLSTKIP
jgi:hypothetical protein